VLFLIRERFGKIVSSSADIINNDTTKYLNSLYVYGIIEQYVTGRPIYLTENGRNFFLKLIKDKELKKARRSEYIEPILS